VTRDSVTMTFRRSSLILLSALVLLALGTYLAGERTEVAVLRSYEADGTPKDTKSGRRLRREAVLRIGRRAAAGRAPEGEPRGELTRRGGAPSPRVAAVVAEPDTIRRSSMRSARSTAGWTVVRSGRAQPSGHRAARPARVTQKSAIGFTGEPVRASMRSGAIASKNS